MTLEGWLEIAFTLGLAVLVGRSLGGYIARVWMGEPTWLDPVLEPVERAIYRACGVDPRSGQSWLEFALSFIAFNATGALLLYGLLRLQGWLPLNPQGAVGLTPDLAFNVAISAVTNTGWEAYSGERALSTLSQMAGMTMQGFASAASGIAVAAALAKAIAANRSVVIGNFWVLLLRVQLYILLPGAIVLGLALTAAGVPQTLMGRVGAVTLEGPRQTIALGPVASQKSISLLGTEGGGYFNTNSAHPFENPSPLTNLIEAVAMSALSFGCLGAFGRVIRARSEGRALTLVIFSLSLISASAIYVAETHPTPAILAARMDQGANMEGKEVRFGVPASSVFAAMTTGSSAGAVNSSHESFTPMGGGIALFMMQIGETLPGGAGSGLYGIVVVALLAVFVCGQMVGRTPEYLGKKIEAREIKLTMLGALLLSACILGFTAVAAVTPKALLSVSAKGPHGLSEILYAYASASANNGSAFAGLRADTVYWNVTMAIGMLVGRFGYALPVLAIAGSLAAKPKLPPTGGTFPTDGPLFICIMVGVILIMTGLQYFPALALGPIVEQAQMARAAH